MLHRDLFRAIKVLKAFDRVAITADKTDWPVIDRADYPGLALGFIWSVDTITTGDATNFFTLYLYHAAAKASSTALTAGVVVPSAQMYGTSHNGVYNASHTPWPLIDDVACSAGDVFFHVYNGQLRYLQPQADETLTASIALSCLLVGFNEAEFQNLES